MVRNSNLNSAKKLKNDEFYTLFSDIRQELQYYEKNLNDKIVLCNCNDGENSAFWQYLSENFERLKLQKLIAVSYGTNAYKLEMTSREACRKTDLQGNGDFRSEESIDLLDEADVVLTNPPFSLFREYIRLLLSYQKKFLIVGSMNMVVCKEIFPYFKSDQIRFGLHSVKSFAQKNGEICKFGNVLWYTNLECNKQKELLDLQAHYIPDAYPYYDNYPAIEVRRIADIPCDYSGMMGVPISYLARHNPKQFKIIGMTRGNDGIAKRYENPIQHRQDGTISNGSKTNTSAVLRMQEKPDQIYYTANNAEGYLVCTYARVLIKSKK